MVSSGVKKKTGYNLFNVDTRKAVKKIIDVPAYFMVSEEDFITLVPEVNSLYENYGCSVKKFAKLSGKHHTERKPMELIETASFLKNLVDSNIQQNSLVIENPDKPSVDLDAMYSGELEIAEEEAEVNSTKEYVFAEKSRLTFTKFKENSRQSHDFSNMETNQDIVPIYFPPLNTS